MASVLMGTPDDGGEGASNHGLSAGWPAAGSRPGGRRLSVAAVIPLYNGGRYIEAALRSVWAQTVVPDEIIVVNDGSTDDGPDVVARLAQIRPITILTKPNGGQSSARNMGVAHARSDLIAFLDQDDIWYPPHIAELSRPFEHDEQVGLVYSNLDEIDDAGDLRKTAVHNQIRSKHPKPDVAECLRTDMEILPTAAIVRRSSIEAVGGFDERLSGYEDDDLFLRILQAGYSNSYLAVPLGQWRRHEASSFHSPRMERSRLIYAEKLSKMFPNQSRIIDERFFGAARRQLYLAVKSGNRDLVRQYLAESRSYLGRFTFRRRFIGYGELLSRIARGYWDRRGASERRT
jgi:glycosyltransferase involved in cell wall biosynthesis